MGIAWKEDLSTGVDVVDEQHKELFRRINDFLEACDAGRGKEELLRMLQFLDDYVVFHFRAEERLQEEEGYHDRERHKEYHRWFVSQLTDLKRRFLLEGQNELLMKDINRLVVGWLLDHIAEKDRDFGRTIAGSRH